MTKNLTIKWYESIDSTNTVAIRESDTSNEGTVWAALYQTAGRGQRGNKWESSKGDNLTFTALFKPTFISPARQFAISEISAIGVCKYLEEKGLTPKIKWPNDIYIGDKKICGMLIEHTLSGDKLSASISGIGININQEIFNSNAPNPTSLILELKRLGKDANRFNIKEELPKVLEEIYTLYHFLQQGAIKEIHKLYIDYLYRFNELHTFVETDPNSPADIPVEQMVNGNFIKGRIIDISPSGLLIIKQESGEIKNYSFKEIKYILPSQGQSL